jgi:hypothetical protein
MEKIFVSGFSSKIFIDVFNSREFKKKHEIVGWCLDKYLIKDLKNKNKFIDIFDIHFCIRGFEPSQKTLKNTEKIELNCKKIFYDNYNQFINLFSRVDPENIFNLYNRETYIKQIINAWHHYIILKNIKTIFLFYTPHLIHDYAIYQIAKLLKLKIIILESTKYIKTYFFINKIEQLPYFEKLTLNKVHKRAHDKFEIKKFLENRKKITFSYISDIKNYQKREAIKYKLGILYYIYLFMRTLLSPSKKLFNKNSIIWTYKKENYLSLKNLVSEKDNLIFSIKNNLTNKILDKKYIKMCSKINLDTKYIYYSGSLLPEKSTIPDAINNYNDIENIRLIREVFGKKIPIYYKIHPLSFIGNNISHNYIDEISFKTIADMDNIKLVNYNFNQADLVKNSFFNATISGDIGIESVLNNKPCILFGNTWFANCEGNFMIKDVSDLIIFKNKINHLKIDIKKFKKEIYHKIYKKTFSFKYNDSYPLYDKDETLNLKNKKNYNKYIQEIIEIFKNI